jgi:hypothetical protein
MQCSICEKPAERACTRCGGFFCAKHGGKRLIREGVGENSRIVRRAICDKCTPNQHWMRFRRTIGAILFFVILLIVILAYLRFFRKF